jgi:hypothetical protein
LHGICKGGKYDAIFNGLKRSIPMASNFQLLSYRNKDSLHLQLYGDFDGSSAYELINTLKKNGEDFIQIFIDTNDLGKLYSFGLDVFQNNKAVAKKCSSFIFIGKYKHSFAV